MKGNTMLFAPLCLVLCWMLPANSMMIRFSFTLPDANKKIPLNMAEDSVDDMYFGCNDAMANKVKKTYMNNEINKKSTFPNAWKEAEQCAENNLIIRETEDEALTKEHMQAICVYTSDYKLVYKEFNEAVRKEGRSYSSSFKFHSLHFLLTSAVQILNSNKACHTTYRRTNVTFPGKVGQIIRFGSFASSSYKTTLTIFGNKTCFKIKTCSGAFLKHYPTPGDGEQEVLIPPYETFKITKKTKGKKVKGLDDCKVVYILQSAGVHSNLNCKVVNL